MEFIDVMGLILGETFLLLVSESHIRDGKSHKLKDMIC